MDKYSLNILVFVVLVCQSYKPVNSEPWLSPGDVLIRNDLQLLADEGFLKVPLTTWPLSLGNIGFALEGADISQTNPIIFMAYQRISRRLNYESRVNHVGVSSFVSGSSNPLKSRTFEDTPREEGEVGGAISWMGRRFAIKVQGLRASSPLDNDSFRPDGSYIGLAVGNWMLAAGYQDQWWGPGWDGSLILSTNARPAPQLSIKRNITTPFKARWLRWMGPWSLASFMKGLDDERVIRDARLFGLRMTAMPLDGLEIGLSRTAQWCGANRPCSASVFKDLLLGHDNRGVNIDVGDEPGNQLAGIDFRWASPIGDMPYATYLQWIGEDSRQGGPQIGSWLRQLGVEFWGEFPGMAWQYRSHIEWSDTICREGGIGLSKKKFGCAYNHALYMTGYRYQGRSIGHGIDSDSFSTSLGSTLIDSRGNTMNLLLRHMEINQDGLGNPLSSMPQEITELSVSYNRKMDLGVISIGLRYNQLRENLAVTRENSSVEWWVGFKMN